MILLMVLTGELVVDEYELRLLLEAEDVEERRNEVRNLCGDNRAARAWNRGDCIVVEMMFAWRMGEMLCCRVWGRDGAVGCVRPVGYSRRAVARGYQGQQETKTSVLKLEFGNRSGTARVKGSEDDAVRRLRKRVVGSS